jgi:hypothetical protein
MKLNNEITYSMNYATWKFQLINCLRGITYEIKKW